MNKNGLKLSFWAYLATLLKAGQEEVKEPTLTEQTYLKNPLWALLPKKPLGDGKQFVHPVQFNKAQGCFAVADQESVPAPVSIQAMYFLFENKEYYQVGSIVKEMVMDSILDNMGLDITSILYKDGDKDSSLSGLAGSWLDGSQLPLEEALFQASVKVLREGGVFNTVFMPYSKFAKLLLSPVAKIMIENQVSDKVLFEGIKLVLPHGPVLIYPDRSCPNDRIYGLKMGSWSFCHHGEQAVNMVELNGDEKLAKMPLDNGGFELRMFVGGNLVCSSPRDNIVVKVS